jgi:hypothetical protein
MRADLASIAFGQEVGTQGACDLIFRHSNPNWS